MIRKTIVTQGLTTSINQKINKRMWALLLTLVAMAPDGWIPGVQTTNSTEDSGDKVYKVVCYFARSAWYRLGAGKFTPEDIDTKLCTHVIYAFAALDAEKLQIKVSDPWADIDNMLYRKIASLAQKGVKVSIGIGGSSISECENFSRLVNNPSLREHFVRHVVGFIDKHGFTGLDLDWEYPKCYQHQCSRGPASDKEGFSALVAELSVAFSPRNWHLSAAVSPSPHIIDVAYDVPHLSKHLDWVNLMAYDYHGSWDGKTGHVAPLYHHYTEYNPNCNVNYSITYWLSKGLSNEKLVVGMPMYGRSFTLANVSNNGINALTIGPGRPGPFTRSDGMEAYYEICKAVEKKDWEVRRVADGSMGPYAFKGDQWVGYDDISDIKKKGELVKAKGLGGGMIWAPDLDDFRNTCGCGRYPLLTALSSTLNGGPAPPVKNCAS